MGTVEEESDESMYWMELLVEGNIVTSPMTEGLLKEAEELLSISVASDKNCA